MQNNLPVDSKKKRNKGCIILLVIAVLFFVLIKSCFSTSPEEDKRAQLNDLKIKALVYSHSCIKEKLKAPASADFPSDLKAVSHLNDSIFIINSYVDSQNSFGAMIRTKYTCKITIIDEDHYRCDDVLLLE